MSIPAFSPNDATDCRQVTSAPAYPVRLDLQGPMSDDEWVESWAEMMSSATTEEG